VEEQPVVEREAVRVILLDESDRVLLIEMHDPARPHRGWYWFTPGGGREPGEGRTECAARELLEETGLRLDPGDLGPVVHEELIEYGFEGSLVRQHQVFLLHRVEAFEVDTRGWDAAEVRSQRTVRWWTTEELTDTSEAIYPDNLLELITRAGRGDASKTGATRADNRRRD
jgi:8-oxo-dGTP pyrophosphatase MutT (NUDIX family)